MTSNQLGFQMRNNLMKGLEVSTLTFVILAENELVDDITITENSDLFIEWDVNWTGNIGTIVRDPDDGKLYQKINANFNTPYPQSQPSKDKSQWRLVGNPEEEWPDFTQPHGAHDAYMKGDKVTFNSDRYISLIDNNVWSPSAYPQAWQKVD